MTPLFPSPLLTCGLREGSGCGETQEGKTNCSARNAQRSSRPCADPSPSALNLCHAGAIVGQSADDWSGVTKFRRLYEARAADRHPCSGNGTGYLSRSGIRSLSLHLVRRGIYPSHRGKCRWSCRRGVWLGGDRAEEAIKANKVRVYGNVMALWSSTNEGRP